MPGNGKVMWEVPDVWLMEVGNYSVRVEDLPAYEIYQCGEKGRQVCLRSPCCRGEKQSGGSDSGIPFDVR